MWARERTVPSPVRVAHIITKLELGGAQQVALFTVAQLNRKHEVVAAMTVHITSLSLEVHSYDRRRRRTAD